MKTQFLRSSVTTAVLSVALSAGPACTHPGSYFTPYFAVIDAIDEQPDDHYSPTKGRKPCYEIRLRRSDAHGGLRIRVLDLYSTEKYGDVGDTVSFAFARAIPVDTVVWFEELSRYKVIR
jgi:hypothetical protein